MVVPFALPAEPPGRPGSLGDLRFRALLKEDEWRSLPEPVRRRFSKRVADGESVVYCGTVEAFEISRIGRWVARLGRLIGGPLPLAGDVGVATIVTVTEDLRCGGQIWTRQFCSRTGFPQVIQSSKRFAGPTGLEEHVGAGVGMALAVIVRDGALVFRSAGYFIHALGRRLRLPDWLTPGDLTVTHAECGESRFCFTLEIIHPRLGLLISQRAIYEETRS